MTEASLAVKKGQEGSVGKVFTVQARTQVWFLEPTLTTDSPLKALLLAHAFSLTAGGVVRELYLLGFLSSQSSPLDVLQVSERPCLKKQGRSLQGTDDPWGWLLSSTQS